VSRSPFSLGRFGLESKLHDYMTGACDEATRAEIEALLARDAKARALLEEMRAAHEALLMLRDRPTPEAPLDRIRTAIASGVFAGKPQPDMEAWGTRFYKRVAAAAVLTCGVSLGILAQHSLRSEAPTAPVVPAPEPGVDVAGEISAFELMRRNNGNLVTVTPTDSVTPVLEFEFDPR